MMLTVIKGATCYDDLRKIGETQYFSYRDACFAMGFLEDDRVYITAIKEAKDWGSSHFLRRLFVIMLLANTMNRPRHVWNETKCWLSDGILYRQRIIANNRGIIYIFINHVFDCYLIRHKFYTTIVTTILYQINKYIYVTVS
jgi:hypothetical protein